MKINWKLASLGLFVIVMSLLGITYGYLTVRLQTLDQQLARYRYESRQRKYAKTVRFWADHELNVRKNAVQANLGSQNSGEAPAIEK